MSCNLNKVLSEVKEKYGDTAEAVDIAIEKMKEMSYSELVDAYYDSRVHVVNAINANRPYLNKQRVELLDIRENPDGYTVKYKYGNSDKVYTKDVGEYSPFTFGRDGASFQMDAKKLNELYSDYDGGFESDSSVATKAADNVNNPEQMRALGKRLAKMSSISDEMKDVLLGVLDSVVDPMKKYIPEMSVWLREEAEKTGGKLVLDGEKMGIHMVVGNSTVGKSPLEVFVHEVVHAATAYAIESRDATVGAAVRRLQDLREEVVRALGDDPLADYLSDGSRGLHEFVAHAMTNEKVIWVLKRMKPLKAKEEYPNLFSKVVGYIQKMFEAMTMAVRHEKRDMDGHTLAVKLVHQLTEVNNRALLEERSLKRSKFYQIFVKVEDNFRAMMAKAMEKDDDWEKKVAKELRVDNVLAKGWGLTKLVAMSVVDERAKKLLGATMDLFASAGLTWLNPEASVREAMAAMAEGDKLTDRLEVLMHTSASIQQRKENMFSGVAHDLQNGFSEKLSNEDEVRLTDTVLDTDLQSVYWNYDMRDVLVSEHNVQREIDALKAQLKEKVSEEELRYMSAQAKGLGKYMVTGKGHPAQLLNAWNIARMAHSRKEKAVADEAVAEIVDKMATMEALVAMGGEKRMWLRDMIVAETNGMDQLVGYQTRMAMDSRYKLFSGPGDRAREMKGYSKQVYDRNSDIAIAPVKDEAEMAKMGYVKKAELKKHSLDKSTEVMAVYVSGVKIQQNLNRVTLMYNGKQRRGTTFTEVRAMSGDVLKAKRDISAMRKEVESGADEMMRTGMPLEVEDMTVLPVYDQGGGIVDFRYVANKEVKEGLLGMDRRAINVVARGYASVYEKSVTGNYNDLVMAEIEKDAAENYNPKVTGSLGLNMKRYVMVQMNSPVKEVADLWNVLPQELKEKYPGGFPIRRDLMHWYMGYRDRSVADTALVKMTPKNVQLALRVVEQIWKDIVQVTKADWIIKTPIVLVGNVVSNFMYSVTTGENPVEVARLQMEGVKELNEYLKKQKELDRLQRKVDIFQATEEDKRHLNRLKNDLKDSTVAKLVEEGFYTTIAEDLGLEEYGSRETLTGKWVNDKMANMPAVVRDGADWMWLTSRTPVYKFVSAATTYSDFAARYAHYHLMMKNRESVERKWVDGIKGSYGDGAKVATKVSEYGMHINELVGPDMKLRKDADKVLMKAIKDSGKYEEMVVKTVREAFVNYHKPTGYEYLNQMGMMMFTKWYFNIQRAIANLAKGHPLKAIISLLGQEFVLNMDIETMEDSQILTRMYEDDEWTKMFGVSVRNPLDHIEKVLVPPGLEVLMNTVK